MHDEPAARHAALTRVERDAEGDGIGGIVEIGVGEDDLRILAAQFQPDLLHVAAGRGEHRAAYRRRAGERDHVDVHVFRERLADHRAEPRHHVDDAIGQARFGQQRGELERRARREFRGLDDHRASRRERERQALREDEERKIPRRDDAHHADRLPHDEPEHIGAERVVRVAVHDAREARRVFPDACRRRDFAARLADGLAAFERLQIGQRLDVVADQLRRFQQHRRALLAREPRPAAVVECAPRGCDRDVQIAARCPHRGGHRHAVAGALARHPLAAAPA